MDSECRCELCVWYPPAPEPIPSMTGNLEDGIPMTKAYRPGDYDPDYGDVAPPQLAPRRPATHRVDVTLTSGGFGQVLVDGTDVSGLCTGLTVFSVPRRGPKVVLELDGRPVKLVSDAAAVEVGGDTYDLLMGLGWTPPAAPQVPVASERKDVQD